MENFPCTCQPNANDEKLSADKVEVMLYCVVLADTISAQCYCMNRIFNADGTGLNYKMLSSKTLAVRADREASGAKRCKEHVTSQVWDEIVGQEGGTGCANKCLWLGSMPA